MSILTGSTKLEQVFLSSTSDLREEREEIQKRLSPRFHVVLNEQQPAEPVSPREWCEREIRRSAVVVGLLGHLPGTEIGGTPIVEWEFEQARKWKVWLSAFVKVADPSLTIAAAQQRFRDKVSSWTSPGMFRGEYTSTADLMPKIWSSLTLYLQRRRMARILRISALIREYFWWIVLFVSVVIVLSILFAASYPLLESSASMTVVALLLLFVAGAGAFVLFG